MAQHLLVAADRFALARLRRICERRLCETVEVRIPSPSLSSSDFHAAFMCRFPAAFSVRMVGLGADGQQSRAAASCKGSDGEWLVCEGVREREGKGMIWGRELQKLADA